MACYIYTGIKKLKPRIVFASLFISVIIFRPPPEHADDFEWWLGDWWCVVRTEELKCLSE